MKKFLLIYFLMVANIFAQGSRPPVSTLSGLTDVHITSPSTLDFLQYDSGTSKWINSPMSPLSLAASLQDVLITSPADKQLLRYNAGTVSWVNYGPLAFTDIVGSIAVTQLNSGTGATAATYWRGDNTWAAPPVGGIAVSTNVLVGDNAGNAIPSTTLFADNTTSSVQVIKGVNSGDTTMKVDNPGLTGGATASLMLSGQAVDPGVTLRYYEGSYPTTGMIQNTDASLSSAQGRLLISGKNNILFSSDGALLATERMRLGSGLMIGTTIDKGGGTANVTGGFYVNGNKIGGVATVTTTTDQTSTSETVHLVYTVPANTVQIGTTFRIFAWGNMDNSTAAPVFTPRIRWGGTGGISLITSPLTVVSTSTALTNKDWEFNARVTIRSIGNALTGTATAMMHMANHTQVAAGTYASDETSSGATAVSIDTTANKDICLTWTISTPSGTPHVRTLGGVIEIVEP